MKLETKRASKKAGGHLYLVVNGIENHQLPIHQDKNGFFSLYLREAREIHIIQDISLRGFAETFSSISLPYSADWNESLDRISIEFRATHWRKFPSIDIELRPDFELWARPYSLTEYAEILERVIKSRKTRGFTFCQKDEMISNGFGLRCRITPKDLASDKVTIHGIIDRCVQEFKEVCDAAEKLLMSSARRNSLTTFFSFPPEIRTACEQYLLYFIQFLDDLGIRAEGELKEQAKHVLFSVTPKDGSSALETIRLALEMYLRLPEAPDFEKGVTPGQDIAAQQLHSNVSHLKAQLSLGQAVIQAKDATIQALEISNYQYRQMLLAGIPSSQSETNETSEKSKPLPVVGDTIHIKKYEGKLLSIDIPTILRRLRRVLG